VGTPSPSHPSNRETVRETTHDLAGRRPRPLMPQGDRVLETIVAGSGHPHRENTMSLERSCAVPERLLTYEETCECS
jgi:hypothetical protein